jgi:pimeloyl-ACP methyl ester carboxylesterase
VFKEVVDTLKPEMLIGHSLGGWLAADYAIERPALVKKLILVDPGGLVTTEIDRENYRTLFEKAVKSGSKDLLPHVFSKAPLLLPFFEEEFFSFLKSDEVRSFVGSFADRHLLNGKIGKIRADTVVIWGENDTLTPAHWLEQWLEQLPNDRKKSGIVIRGSGHSPQIEKPGALIALFTQIFLGRKPLDLKLLPWRVLKDSA